MTDLSLSIDYNQRETNALKKLIYVLSGKTYQFLDAGVDTKEIPLPREFILNRDLLGQLYPCLTVEATLFFTLNWSKYLENLLSTPNCY